MKKWKDIEFIIRIILSGVLMNGWIQGKENKDLDMSVIEVAIKEIKKLKD